MKKVFMTVVAVLYVVVMTGFFYMLLNDGHMFSPKSPFCTSTRRTSNV